MLYLQVIIVPVIVALTILSAYQRGKDVGSLPWEKNYVNMKEAYESVERANRKNEETIHKYEQIIQSYIGDKR